MGGLEPPPAPSWLRYWVGGMLIEQIFELIVQAVNLLLVMVIFTGGVEDTRVEAKNTKKNPRPRPRTALPKKDPLEGKDQ